MIWPRYSVACQGKVVLSGYPSALYDVLYRGWRTVSFDLPNNAAGAAVKAREIERLWSELAARSTRIPATCSVREQIVATAVTCAEWKDLTSSEKEYQHDQHVTAAR